ncbi:hypothetical protein O181_105512 [Austropuccinia psidii MF-1]|uniref:Reverse transcriptase Ty1/copia-type domain-containing protein n=1 Tax=Austropuccinia psidii MF-1 TaxID=1389203 RepID=A0A9Q3JNN4_9BASI|nr:hypothetical protein [Austropuccinia psidii MF-1]
MDGCYTPPGEAGILLGYENNNSAYRILKISNKKVYTSRHVTFFKNHFPELVQEPESDPSPLHFSNDPFEVNYSEKFYEFNVGENSEEEENIVQDRTVHADEETSAPPLKRIRVIRPRHPTLIRSDISHTNILPYHRRPVSLFTHTNDPNSFNKAVKSTNSEFCIAMVKRELNAMTKLNVWEVIPIKEEYKLIRTTWVLKAKRGINNEITEYKARLFAQGFLQTQGVDYTKRFALIGWLSSLRALISLSTSRNLKLEQLDIKSHFLSAKIEEDMYLSIPQGLDEDKRQTCLKLKKEIYRLKQALGGRDPICLFFHVDDIGVFGDNLTLFKKEIEEEFSTKIIGSVDLMLGIEISHLSDSITLSQAHYVDSVLELYGMTNCRLTETPMVPNLHLEEASDSERKEFQTSTPIIIAQLEV